MDFDQNAAQFGRCQHVAHPLQHLFLKALDIHLNHVRHPAQAFAYGIATADLHWYGVGICGLRVGRGVDVVLHRFRSHQQSAGRLCVSQGYILHLEPFAARQPLVDLPAGVGKGLKCDDISILADPLAEKFAVYADVRADVPHDVARLYSGGQRLVDALLIGAGGPKAIDDPNDPGPARERT